MKRSSKILICAMACCLVACLILVAISSVLAHSSSQKKEDEFYQALKLNDQSMIISFLNEGVDVNMKPVRQTTPLVYACRHSSYETIKLLLENGADVHNKTGTRYPLRQAVMRGDLNIVKLLLDSGADIHYRYPEDSTELYHGDLLDTAFELAAGTGQIEILRYLQKNYKIPEEEWNNALSGAAEQNEREVVTFLFENHSFPNSIIDNAMARSIRNTNENFGTLAILVNRGANVNWIGNRESMLDLALYYKHKRIVNLLKEHGAKTAKQLGKQN